MVRCVGSPLNSASIREMGISKSKLSCASKAMTMALEPSMMIRADPTTEYVLEFSANVSRWNSKKSVKKQHVEGARRSLESDLFWEEWLESTMKDAMEETVGEFLDVSIHTHKMPPVLDITIELDPPGKKTRRNPEGHTEITGVISWRSIMVSEKSIENAIEWRLGDRLNMYGIQDEQEKWSCYFHPGTLLIS